MTVETALYPNQLNASWPAQSDIVREGAGHIRAVKTVLKTTFPNVTGAVSPTHVELNYMVGVSSGVQSQIDSKGSIAGQTWSGTHVFPGATTIGPLTPAIQAHLSGVTSDVQAQIDAKVARVGDTYSGTHDMRAAIVRVPTATTGDASDAVASTAFVSATAFAGALPGQSGNAGKFVTTDGTNAKWSLIPGAATSIQTISTNTTAVPGVYYIATTAGITLTIPAGWLNGDYVGGRNASGGNCYIDWGANTLLGETPESPMRWPARGRFETTNNGSTFA